MRKRRRHQQLGLTIIEVMIAAGILALAMVMAMGALVNISTSTAQSEDRAAAAAVVSSVIEQMRATNIRDLRNFDPNAVMGGRVVASAWVITNDNDIALPAAQDVANAAFDAPVQVRVRADWVDNGGRRHFVDTTTVIGD